MNPEVANTFFPLFRFEFTEGIHGRDTGMPYSDPENDIRQFSLVKYFIKESLNSDWKEIYSENLSLEGIYMAINTIGRLKEIYDRRKYTVEDYPMFEYCGHIFKTTHYTKDLCVLGEAIEDYYYNEYEDDNSIKVDMIKSIVFIHRKDTIVGLNKNLYMNGEKLISYDDLLKEFNSDPKMNSVKYSYHNIEAMYPPSVVVKIKEMFPNVRGYDMKMCSGQYKEAR